MDDPKPYPPLDPAQRLAAWVPAPPEPEISSVAIEMTHGELAVLALGLSEMSTHEQRAHAREVLHGWVSQAFDAIAEEIIHGRK